MSKRKKEKGRTVYAKMLGNIASDLDSILTDLHDKKYPDGTNDDQHVPGPREEEEESARGREYPHGTMLSADTLGKDSFLSSVGNTSCRRHGDVLNSTASLLSGGDEGGGCGGGGPYASDVNVSNIASDGGLHSRSGGAQPEVDVDSSVDSGHGGTGRSRSGVRDGACGEVGRGEHPRASPLVFDPQHFSRHSPLSMSSSGARVVVDVSPSGDEFRPISTVERLVKTNSIWLLASLSRAGAVHILKDRDTGNFIVRKSSQPQSLALSVQSRLCGHSAVDHYLIQGTPDGFRLEGSAHFFHSIPALISYYIENIDEIPYHLRLPVAIQQARSTRELASLDMLGQDFWSSTLSHKPSAPNASFIDGQLHKSHSEPINIQKNPSSSHALSQQQIINNTPPSRSTEGGFSQFMHSQTEMEKYFAQGIHDSSLDGPQSRNPHDNFVGSSGGISNPLLQVTTALVVSLPNSSSMTSSTKTPPPRALPSLPSQFSPSPQNHHEPGKEMSPVHRMAGSSPEPIYSVSKKQIKKTSKPVLDATDCGLLGSHSNPEVFGAAFQSHEPSISNAEPSSVPLVQLAVGDEDPYRSSPCNKPAGGVITTSTSWEQGLSGAGVEEGNRDDAGLQARVGGDVGVHRPKANLYFTTNLNLLEIPENTYFTSNLSDRLSDYEDIWRTSSCAESDQDPYRRYGNRMGSQNQGATTMMISDPRSVMDARFSQQQQQQQQQASSSPNPIKEKMMGITGVSSNAVKEGKRKVLRKTSRDSPISRRIPMERDAVTGGTTGLTALEQARKIAGSTSDEDSVVSPSFYPHHQPPPVAHVKGIQRLTGIYDYDDEENKLEERTDEQQSLERPLHFSAATPTSLTSTTNRTVAVSRTAVVTNTNSIRILPSRPNQIKFVTSHSLDFSPRGTNSLSVQSPNATLQAISSMALTPTPTSSKSLPASIAKDPAQTCVFTTTMAVLVSEANDQQPAVSPSVTARTTVPQPDTGTGSDTKTKEKPSFISPLSRLSRLKSSSESSLATVSSPLYAEPADAVKLRDKHGKAINIQVRRQSAPSGPQQLFAAARSKERQQHQASSKVSQNPKLDTILSPDAESNDGMAKTGNSTKFKFEDVNAGTAFTASGSSLARSHSLRTPYEQSQLQRKQSWKDRLNRLKLGTRVLTRNLTPPSAPSARKHQMTAENYDNIGQIPPSPCSPGKFPVFGNPFSDPRASIFSESSTVQDLISCAHPEFSVRPIRQVAPKAGDLPGVASTREVPAAPSEYDNLGIYRASTHSSLGTVYLPPWEISAASRLVQESPKPVHSSHQEPGDSSQHQCPPPLPSQPPMQQLTSSSLSRVTHKLPPAMDFQERIARWQESNTTYMHHEEASASASTSYGAGNAHISSAENRRISSHQQNGMHGQFSNTKHKTQSVSQKERNLQQQQQQLLHHQRQLKHKNSNGNKENIGGQDMKALQRQNSEASSCQQQKQLFKQSTIGQQYSGNNMLCQPLSPQSPMSSVTPIVATITTMSAPPPLSSSPAPFSSSATPTSPYRLSSHCPDVVHCHSTPVPTTPSSPSFNMLLPGREDNADLTAAQMIGEDDVLFGGSLNMASPELQRQISPILSPEFSSNQENKAPGTRIREYIFKLSSDHQTIFGSTIENFIQCTLESQETNPEHVMRNVRQFMTGIKNYLVKHGEGMLEDLIERERNKLGANDILNIDAIIEQALHVCVLKPLKYHIYHLFVEKYNASGALEQLSRNIKYARTKSAEDLGVKPGLKVPGPIDMEVIKYYLDLMQRSYSPLQKLQNLLKATSTIYHCVQGKHHQFPSRGPSSLGADDFLPMLIYVLVHCGLVAAEIEADFMWGLLQQSLLTGEGGYYLTTLSSAVLVLKKFQETHDLAPNQLEGHLPTLSDMQGFLKIAIPDELHDSINWKTLPVRPNMNTKDVCALVAHKFKVTNPQDYGLFVLCDGQESQVAEGDCPQVIKGDYQALKKTCFFAFKRLDANIAWPKQIQEPTLSFTDTM